MRVFNAEWWSLKVPGEAAIETTRDCVTLCMPGQYEVRLIVLRGEAASATAAELEAYAKPFCAEAQNRVNVDNNGWRGFSFVNVDEASEKRHFRGYVWKGRYLLIAVVNPENSTADNGENVFADILDRIEIKGN